MIKFCEKRLEYNGEGKWNVLCFRRKRLLKGQSLMNRLAFDIAGKRPVASTAETSAPPVPVTRGAQKILNVHMDGGTFITEQKRHRSDFEEKYLARFGFRPEPKVNVPGLSPELVSRRQELESMQQQLSDGRVGYERWLKEYEVRKEDVEERKRKIEEEERLHMTFNKHTQEEIDKIKQQIAKEYDLTQKYTKQLSVLDEKGAALQTRLQALKSELAKLQPAADFVDHVVTETKSFETPDSIVQKYEILNGARTELRSELSQFLSTSDATMTPKARLAYLKDLLVEKNHQYASLRDDLEKLRQQARYEQTNITKAAERSIEKEAEKVKIVSAIESMCAQTLLNQARESSGRMVRTKVPANIEDQLEIIEQRFLDLKAVTSDPEAVILTAEEVQAKQRLMAPLKTGEFTARRLTTQLSNMNLRTNRSERSDPSSALSHC